MKLSILIAGLFNRPYKTIVDKLQTQINKLDVNSQVQVLMNIDTGKETSGSKRQQLLDYAIGDYICYVDDDDDVHDEYVKYILTGCYKEVDVVSFNMDFHRDGFYKETWTLGCYPNSRRDGIMLVNHLCAWKKELARKVSWSPFLGNSDDHVWSQPLFFSGSIETQYHINKSLYKYIYQSQTTVNQSADKRKEALNYFQKGVRCFWYGKQIVLEHDPRLSEIRNITVRFGCGEVRRIPIEELIQFYTVLP